MAFFRSGGGTGSSVAQLLWTNPNYNVGALSGSVDLSSYHFTHLIITKAWDYGSNVATDFCLIPFQDGTYKMQSTSSLTNSGQRAITISNGVITWGASYTGNGQSDTNNYYNYPVQIYGVNMTM